MLAGTPPAGYGWGAERAQDYVAVLLDIADASRGGICAPLDPVDDSPDFEDNRILECARESGSLLMVSEDDLTGMSPWRGIPVFTSAQFVARTDVARRRRR